MSEDNILNGVEIYDTYGAKCNSRYLLNYGFTLEGNENDNTCEIIFDVEEMVKGLPCSKETELFRSLPALLRNIDNGYSGYEDLITNKTENEVTGEKKKIRIQPTILANIKKNNDKSHYSSHSLFSMMRVMCLTKGMDMIKLDKLPSLKLIDVLTTFPVLDSNRELMVLQMVSKVCKERLEKFKVNRVTALDKKFRSQLYSKFWNIYNMLASEQKVLESYVELYEGVKEAWENGNKDPRNVIKYLKERLG